MKNILDLALEIDKNTKGNISHIQHYDLTSLKLMKKVKRIGFKTLPKKIVTENRWKTFFKNDSRFEFIPKDFFEKPLAENDERLKFLEGKILIVSNTPPQSGSNVSTLVNFYNLSIGLKSTLIAIWDWDNHHHLHISSLLSAISDVYFPSHKAHNFELNSFCDHMTRIPASSHQWNDEEIIVNLPKIMDTNRQSDVGGGFVRYELFPLRNNQIEVLGRFLNNIKLLDNLDSYLCKSSEDKLNDWTRYKCQWIIPTLNDVSTRIFDALITGNLVILPERFRHDECFENLHEDDCEYYSDDDIYNPLPTVSRAIDKCDKWGATGVFRRVNFGLSNNLDKRIESILGYLEEKYIKPSALD